MPAAAAMLPPEPVRFSTTNCWPKWSDSHWLMMRATVSTGPPAEKPIIQRTGRVGYSAAEEDEGRVARLKRQDRANIDPRQNPLMMFPCHPLVVAVRWMLSQKSYFAYTSSCTIIGHSPPVRPTK
jgi:hypothetical protein